MCCFPVQVSIKGFKASNQDDAFHASSPKNLFIFDLKGAIGLQLGGRN
jgi:hypothetical protein